MSSFAVFLVGILGFLGGCHAYAAFHDPSCGGRRVIVHLFEWKWTDVAKECKSFLGPMGFCGVQVSPPNEHVIVTTDAMRPWWERYQPVSYKLKSRSGNEDEFKAMVKSCNDVGVRIYADIVVNHMAGEGRKGTGSAGSYFDSSAYNFPAIPYTKANFIDKQKCPKNVNLNDNHNPDEIRDCYPKGLTNLDLSQTYVQDKVSGYLNHLIDLGVTGFRINGAKHIRPANLKAIQAKTKNLPNGKKPFYFQQVIEGYKSAVTVNEYFNTGYVTEFRYCEKIKQAVNDFSLLSKVYDSSWGMAPSDQALIFVDNHDNERVWNNEALTFKQPAEYKRAVAFTLANKYGFTRVMSSYNFNSNEAGPPHNSDYSTMDVFNTATGGCGNGWVCEHRWRAVSRMVKFRNAVGDEDVQNLLIKNDVVSFNRGTKGFFAMAKNDFTATINTGLPPGEYCDLISDCARKIVVGSDKTAEIRPAAASDPFVAIITKNGVPYDPTDKNDNYQRTVIMIEKTTVPGEDIFIDGGIAHRFRPGCKQGVVPSRCSIPIKHTSTPDNSHYDKVKAWSVGDNYLDWYGAESGQGKYNNEKASGTPAYWSTNDPAHPGHHALNKYGPHYWVVDVDMDCSKTINGYFEFKIVDQGQWEGDIKQDTPCKGDSPGVPSFSSQNHIARCGYHNVFHYNNPGCEINKLS